MAPKKSEETSFPRGGASVLTPLEHRQISIQAAQDLFKSPGKSTSSNDKRKVRSDDGPSAKRHKTHKKKTIAPSKPIKSQETTTVVIDRLSTKDLTPGTCMIGCITKIKELELIVALPSHITGVVPITEISDPISAAVEHAANDDDDDNNSDDSDEEDEGVPDLDKLFFVGQFVQCRVLRTTETDGADTKKRVQVELSLRPELVNQHVSKVDATIGTALTASVQSVEDHGYVLSLGIQDVTGFCKSNEAESYIEEYNRGEPLVPGQIVQCVVTKTPTKDQRAINVTLNHGRVAAGVVKEPVSNIQSVVPGMMVTGQVDAVQPNGLKATFMGVYDATIEAHQIPGAKPLEYSVGQQITFRVLFVIYDPSRKAVGGTLLPHLLELAGLKNYVGQQYPHGTLLEDVKIERIVRNKGVYLSIEGAESVVAFASIGNLSDDRIEAITESSEKYHVGSTHKARVLSYNPIDDLLSVTLKPSIVSEKYGNINEIKVGDIVEATVQRIVKAGLSLKLSSGISALVLPIHYADAPLQHPELKFKTGTVVRGRVLEVDSEGSRMLVTLKQSLIDSTLPIISSWDNVKPGMVAHGIIKNLRPAGAIIRYYNGIGAFVPASQMTEARVPNLESVFRVGQTVKTYIHKVDEERNKIIASLTTITKAKKEEKEARKKEKAKKDMEEDDEKYAIGNVVNVTVKSIKEMQLNIKLENGRHGRVHITEAFTDASQITDIKNPLSKFQKGQTYQAKILGVRDSKEHGYLAITRTTSVQQVVECSFKLDGKNTTNEVKAAKVGKKYMSFVRAIHKKNLEVVISSSVFGVIRAQFTSSDPEKANNFQNEFSISQMVPVETVLVDKKKHPEFIVDDPAIRRVKNIQDVTVGLVGLGVVQRVAPSQGVFVQMNTGLIGRVHRLDLVDEFVENPLKDLKEGTVVRYAVVNVNKAKKITDLSLRSCRTNPDVVPEKANKEINTIADVEADQVLMGYVNNIANSGVFVSLGRSVSARIKIGYLSDEFVKDWKSIYKCGQLVKCKILSVDAENNQIEGALNKSRVEGTGSTNKKRSKQQENKSGDNDVEMPDASSDDDDEEEDEDEDDDMPDVREADEDMEEAEVDEEDSDDDDEEEDSKASALSLGKGFDWTGTVVDTKEDEDEGSESDESEDDDDGNSSSKKKSVKQVEDKTAELSTSTPQSAADYERMIVGSPNSSFVWINYMAYQLQLSEIDKAREIGERALTTISFREEQEKMNVWVAMLNLENTYGSDESLDAIFKRACVYCEPEKLYIRLAEIYERSEKYDKAEQLLQETVKKFSQEPKFWIQLGLFYLKRDNVEAARELLQRSLKVLPKHHHVETISKFAQMEFKHGEPERGRTIFEGLLSSYPKRIDIWNVYVDMEIRAGDQDAIRRLFERLTSMKVSSKKMKFFFKKWLQYEKEHGAEEDAERVKEKALAYVNSSNSQ